MAFTAVNTSLNASSDKKTVEKAESLVETDSIDEISAETVISTETAISTEPRIEKVSDGIDLPNISNLSAHAMPLEFSQRLAPPPLPTTPLIPVIPSASEPTSRPETTHLKEPKEIKETKPKRARKMNPATLSPTPLPPTAEFTEILRASSVTGGAYYHNNPYLYPQSRSRANPPLDFSALGNKANFPHDLDIDPRPVYSRAFGLQEAPTVFPSAEEFSDPMKYINNLAQMGRQFGMIKIVPPESWNPRFHLDTELFWFKTRRQNLNARGGAESVKREFLTSLIDFCMATQRMSQPPKLPSIDKRPVDLYHLYECVKLRGGFQEVCKKKLWAQVGRELGYTGRIMTSLSTSLKSAYQRILLPYTESLEKELKTETKKEMDEEIKLDNDDKPTKRIKLDEKTTLSVYKDRSRYPIITESESFLMRERRMGPKVTPHPETTPNITPGYAWPAAQNGVDESKRDLSEAPSYNLKQFQQKAERFKEKFIERDPMRYNGLFTVVSSTGPSPTRDLSLNLNKRNKHSIKLSDELFEQDFWRVVTDENESLEVEYGMDIHSAVHGSSFLEPERDILPDLNALSSSSSSSLLSSSRNIFPSALPGSSELESGGGTADIQAKRELFTNAWNLNILPINEESPFRFIDTDVPGLVKPWLSIGMLFSTQCWGVQDHFSYLAQYHVFGDTVTRYSIPEEDYEKYLKLLEKVVNESNDGDGIDTVSSETKDDNDIGFDSSFKHNHGQIPINPILESNKLITPQALIENGIKCFAIDHHPGQLVIIFPKAVTSHFSHGFNLTERVQFATYDWLKDCKDSFKLYRQLRQLPAFSFDKLILNMATNNSIALSAANRDEYVAPLIKQLCEEEAVYRNKIQTEFPTLETIREIANIDDIDYICDYTQVYAYVSRVVNTKLGLTYSPEYFIENVGPNLSKSDLTSYKFIIRYDGPALETIYEQITQAVQRPCLWKEEYQNLLKDTPRPELKKLKALLDEGERVSYYIAEMGTLKSFIIMADFWVKAAREALSGTTKKWTSVLDGEDLDHDNDDSQDDDYDEHTDTTARVKSILEFQTLVDQSYTLPFKCPEMTKLAEKAQSILSYQERIRAVLAEGRKSHNDLEAYKVWIAEGETFGINLPEIKRLKALVFRILWNERAKTQCEKYVSLDQIIKLIQEGLEADVDINDPIMKGLLIKRDSGHSLEDKAKYFLSDERRLMFIGDIDALIAEATFQPVVSETLERLKDLKARYDSTKNQINVIIKETKHKDILHRPTYSRVKNTIENAVLVHCESGVLNVKKGLKGVEDWMKIGKRIFGKGNAPLHILQARIQSLQKRCHSSFSLTDTFNEAAVFKNRLGGNDDVSSETPPVDTESNGTQLFCLCRTPECGLMLECDNCHEWYHAKCLKLNRAKVKADGKFFCPICDWRLASIRDHETCRPPLEDLIAWEAMAHDLLFCPDEMAAIQGAIKDATEFRQFLEKKLAEYNHRQLTAKTTDDKYGIKRGELAELRHYLRKIEGADILLVDETNKLRLMVHQLDPIAPIPPKAVYVMQSSRRTWAVKNVSTEHLGLEFALPSDANMNIDPAMIAKSDCYDDTEPSNAETVKPTRETSTIRSLLND